MPPTRTRTTRAQTRTEYPEQHERTAARRYLEHDHAANTLKGAPAREANHHAQAIDEEHPRARDIAMTGTARELGQLPKHLKRHQARIRHEAALSQEEINRVRREYRRGPYRDPGEHPEPAPAASTPSGGPGPVSQGVGLVGSGLDALGNTSWGSLAGDLFLTGVLLSIAYLMLTKATGVGKLFQGATSVTRAIVSPHIDPLNPKGALL